MRLVPVDAFEFDPDAVEEEPVALDLDGAKPDALRHNFEDIASGVFERDEQRIQIRILGGPQPRRRRFHQTPGMVEQLRRDPTTIRLAGKRGVDLELAIGGCVDMEVGNVRGRPREQVDVAKDAGEPPHILIFQVAPIRPLYDAHSERVLPRAHDRRDVELRRQATAFAEPNFQAVDPDMESRVDTFKPQLNLHPGPVVADEERLSVTARRILRRHTRRVDGEGELKVRVMRSAMTVHLPV